MIPFDPEAYFAAELHGLLSLESARTLNVWRRFAELFAAQCAGPTRAGVAGMEASGKLVVTLETGLPARIRLECVYPYRRIVQYPLVGSIPLDGSRNDVPDESLEYMAPEWLAPALLAGELPTHPCGAGCGAMAQFDDELCPDCNHKRRGR